MSGWSSRMGVRARLWLAVLATVAVALASVTVAFNLYLADSLNSDADKRLSTMTADASGAIIQTDAGYSFPVSTGDIKGLGSQVWVYVRGYTLAAPDLDPALGEAAKALYGQPAQYVDLPEQQVRMFCVPLYDSKGEELIGTIVAAVDMGPYSSTQRLALLATSALTAILLIIVGFAARWVLNAAFRPVSRMTAEAEAWSTADLDRRFEMGEPHDEVTQLAHTLDGLLDRLAASLRREQRFSAEVSHQLRTPVAKIKAEAELALRRQRDLGYYQEALASVAHSADQMARTVETLVAAAQEEGSLARGRADARKVLDNVVVQAPAREIRVGVGADIVTQILQPVVENGVRFARGRVVLGAVRQSKEVQFTIEDDGPGVTEEEKDRIFEPGVRGSAAGTERSASRGAGLGLSLARRLARAASGDVEVSPSAIGAGARFIVRLPGG
jgi:two-component system OmpR family sensor kinase